MDRAVEFAESQVARDWEERYVVGVVAIDPQSIKSRTKRTGQPSRQELKGFNDLRQTVRRRLTEGKIVEARDEVADAGFADAVFIGETREQVVEAFARAIMESGNCWGEDGTGDLYSVLIWHDKSHPRFS
jgi:hypothetical protein